MRKPIIAAAVVAAACVVTVVAQQRESQRDPAGEAGRESAPSRPPGGEVGGPPMEIGSRLEMFLMRPGRVLVRDTWRVGRVDCRPWGGESPGGEGTVRVNAVVAYVHDRPEDRAAGLELVVQDDFADRTFWFDAPQLGELLVAMETVRTTAETMRDPPQDAGRRAVFNLNGLEVGMAPHRAGGYLAPVGPDEPSVGLNPDNFAEMKRLLTEAQAVLQREAAAR
jgi:hypothetical protein